jgi:hypothetical protein
MNFVNVLGRLHRPQGWTARVSLSRRPRVADSHSRPAALAGISGGSLDTAPGSDYVHAYGYSHPYADGDHADSDRYGYPDSHTDADGDAYRNPYADGHRHADGESNRNPYGYPKRNSDADTYSNPDFDFNQCIDRYPNRYPNPVAYRDSNHYSDRDAYPILDTDSDANCEPDRNANIHPPGYVDSYSDSDCHPDSNPYPIGIPDQDSYFDGDLDIDSYGYGHSHANSDTHTYVGKHADGDPDRKARLLEALRCSRSRSGRRSGREKAEPQWRNSPARGRVQHQGGRSVKWTSGGRRAKMKRLLWLAILFLSPTIGRSQPPPTVFEQSIAYVDLTFTDETGDPGLPAEFDFVVNDRDTRTQLYPSSGSQTVSGPTENCPKKCSKSSPVPYRGINCDVNEDCGNGGSCQNPPGCTTVILPSAAQRIVGRCDSGNATAKNRPCFVDGDCGSGGACQSKKEIEYIHVMTVSWPHSSETVQARVLIPVLNLEFFPLP